MVEAEGRADGGHPLADPEVVGVAQAQGRQALGLHLEHRHIGTLVAAHQLGSQLTPVIEAHHDLVGTIDHVGIGHDVAVLADDEAGAQRLALLGAAGALLHAGRHGEAVTEEVAEDLGDLLMVETLEGVATLHGARGGDVDHPGGGLLHQLGEVGQLPGHGALPGQQAGGQQHPQGDVSQGSHHGDSCVSIVGQGIR